MTDRRHPAWSLETRPARHSPRPCQRHAGFTLVELLVTMALIALALAIIVPNLGALIPEAKLDGSAKQIMRQLDWVRSEARIQGRPMSMDFDLKRGLWRIVYPPEQRLTRDQNEDSLEERSDGWRELEDGVRFVSAGDSRSSSSAKNGIYRLTFDEFGFTADQVLAMHLETDDKMVWSIVIQGLNGRMTLERSEQGQTATIDPIGEGAF